MPFDALESQLDEVIQTMKQKGFLVKELFPSSDLLNFLNEQDVMITIHDVQYYKPICINDSMRRFYGFEKNMLKGMDHLYYMQTIHVSTYHTLLESIYFFREAKNGFLNLQYKLLQYDKQWVNIVGTTKTILSSDKGKPLFAMTLLQKNREVQVDSLFQKVASLSKREKEIVSMINAGMAKKEIADRLFLSTHTIQTHVKKIYKKLQVNKISQLNSICDAFNIQEEFKVS